MGALAVHEAASAGTKGELDYRNLDHYGFIATGNGNYDLRDLNRNRYGPRHILRLSENVWSASRRLFYLAELSRSIETLSDS